ncbi:MAG: hypothetical protein JWO94_102 [Verrucomicrobiaceae bacterium]|nr:hypothetical protein [Verrucomicrobiaceae bacterium]
MNRHEAQLLLTAFRPGEQATGDDATRLALEYLRDDPELAQWFADSQALDKAIADRIASVSVPVSLKTDILAGARVSRQKNFWRSGFVWMAVAAMVLVTVLVGFPWVRHQQTDVTSARVQDPVASLAEYRQDVGEAFAKMSVGGFKPTLGVSNMADVARYVSTQSSPLGNPATPGGLSVVKPLACRVIDWRGQKVSIICVGRNNLEAHVFVVDRKAIRDPGNVDVKAVAEAGGYPVAAWEDDQHAYVMVGNTKTTDLSKLLL